MLTTLLQQLLIQQLHPQVTLRMLQQMQDQVRTGVASRIRLNLLPLHLLEQKNQVQLGCLVEENHQTVLTTLLQQLLIQRPHPQVTLRMLQQMQDQVRTGVASRIRLNLLPLHLLEQKNQVQLGRPVEENHQTVLTTLLQQLLIQRPHPQVTLRMLQQMQDRVRTGVASRIRLNLLPLHLLKQKNQVQLGRLVEENHQTVLTTLLQQLLIQRPHPQVTLQMLQQMQDRVRTGVASRIRLNLLPLHLQKQKE